MSQGVVVWTGENTEEETSLLSVLAIVWAITFLVGSLCGVWFERSRSSKTPARSAAFASWERVTVRALRFLAKRRRVSVAFSNYRNHNLRGVNPGPARQRARRRVGWPHRHGSCTRASHCRTMDPTEAELQAITTLQEARQWVGIDRRLEAAVQKALGDPQRVREIALIPRQLWDTTMAALQVEEPGAADGDPPVHRDLSPVEVAKLESLRRVCNLRVGQPADDRGTVLPVAPAAPGPLLPPAGGGLLGKLGLGALSCPRS